MSSINHMNALHNPVNKNPLSFVPVFELHLARYPLMEVQDIYKLVFQASMGPEHLISNKDRSYKKLCEEFDNVEAAVNQSLAEEIDPSGRIVRICLSSFRNEGFNLKNLFDAFFQTANLFQPSIENMEKYLNDILFMAEEKKIQIGKDVLNKFFRMKRMQNFPAVHHSNIYKSAYQPSYRLILKKYVNFLK